MVTLTQPVSVRLDKSTIEHLKRVARYESLERDKDLSYADLIREAIERTYPKPNSNENEENEA
jgi:hypothetical protein